MNVVTDNAKGYTKTCITNCKMFLGIEKEQKNLVFPNSKGKVNMSTKILQV